MIGRRAYPEYKDSGIEWLGEIPDGWNALHLKNIATYNDDALGEKTNPDFEILYTDISSVDKIAGIKKKEMMTFENAPSRARRKVIDGDVIISTVRTYLRAIAPISNSESNLIVSTGFAVIRPTERFDSRFASYALRAPYFVEEVVANSVGVSYPAINTSKLVTFSIALPTKEEQRAIAAFLDRETGRIDALIEKKERQIDLLKEKRSALISHVVTKGLNPDAPMKDSGIEWLGEIPEHWNPLPLKYLVETKITDGPHVTPQLLDYGIDFVSAEAIQDGRINFEARRGFISEDEHRRFCNKCQPRVNDIFLCKSGATTGKLAYVDSEREFSVWSPLAQIRADAKRVFPQFLFIVMQSVFMQDQIKTNWSLGTQPNIAMRDIEQLVVLTPPTSEQASILKSLKNHLKNSSKSIFQIRDSIELLQEFREALISAAVTGKIDVRGEVT